MLSANQFPTYTLYMSLRKYNIHKKYRNFEIHFCVFVLKIFRISFYIWSKMMRNLFIILIIIAIFIAYAESHNNGRHDEGNQKSPPNFNITHILLHSILLCGTDIVCNKSILPALNIQDGLNTPKKCPDCYCDYRCFRYAVQHSYPCCPDYFFQYGYMQCKDLSVFSVGKEEQTAVIASCPSNVNESLSNNCTKPVLKSTMWIPHRFVAKFLIKCIKISIVQFVITNFISTYSMWV